MPIVVDAINMLLPEKVLLSTRSVEEAAPAVDGQPVRQMSPVKQIVVAVIAVVLAPPFRSVRPPKVETPVLLKLSDWIPPAKVDVETLVMVSAFAVVVPAWKVPTTVDEACDTKPLGRVRRLVTVNDPAVSVPIVAVFELMFVDVAPAAKVERPPKYDARVVVAPPKMVRPVV